MRKLKAIVPGGRPAVLLSELARRAGPDLARQVQNGGPLDVQIADHWHEQHADTARVEQLSPEALHKYDEIVSDLQQESTRRGLVAGSGVLASGVGLILAEANELSFGISVAVGIPVLAWNMTGGSESAWPDFYIAQTAEQVVHEKSGCDGLHESNH